MKRLSLALICFLVSIPAAWGETDQLSKLADDTLSYFKPMTGSVLKVEDKKVSLSLADSASAGMRFKVLREGAPFVHPVTKELLGKVEATVGTVGITGRAVEGAPGAFTGELLEGEARPGDKVRISDTKVKVFFCQDKNMDWYLADEYYRKLKASGRVEMIDTALETSDEATLLAEAKKSSADLALLLSTSEAGREAVLKERLFWVRGGSKLLETEIRIAQEYADQLKTGGEFFSPSAGEAILSYNLPFTAKLIASGDVDGDGKSEIILSTGKDIRIYRPGSDLKLLWEIKGSAADDHIGLYTFDRLKNGRNGIIVTSKRNDGVVSSLYELDGPDFKRVLQCGYFVRRVGEDLVAQAYSASEGYSGPVFKLTETWEKGEKLNVPSGINIYDFVLVDGTDREKLIMAYDDYGYLNLYDGKGIRVWRSSFSSGGFLTTFKKQSGGIIRDGGEWSVKDRLIQRRREVLAIQRVPILNMARSIGYKKSSIKNYWWNGFSVEETPLVEGVTGTVTDFALGKEELIVLSDPIMGIKFENILKGESPLGSKLMIYSMKGSL